MKNATETLEALYPKQVGYEITLSDALKDIIITKESKGELTKYERQFYQYIKNYYRKIQLEDVSKDLFNKYLLYFVPKTIKIISENIALEILNELYNITNEISNKYHVKLVKTYLEIYYQYLHDFHRITALKKQFNSYLGYPVENYNPLVINLTNYRKRKISKKINTFAPIVEQGYFDVLEIMGNNSVILKKKWSKELFVKIIVNKNIIQHLNVYDILNMRIKRKLFFTCWEIEDVKGCYLQHAEKYLKK